MNAPLVVVQGDLLLPTLYPLAGMPNAIYGEEWTLTSARPALTEYEIPFYAARFLTAYISPLSLRNDRFPYTPASLWGKFRRNDEMVQGVSETAQDLPPVFADATPQAAEPAPFAFEPFTAPDDRHVKKPASNQDHRKQMAGGAIALACAAFIAWALFGTKIGHQSPDVQTANIPLSAAPAVKAVPEQPVTEPVVSVVSVPDAKVTETITAAPASSAVAPLTALATAAPAPVVQKPAAVVSANVKPLASSAVVASKAATDTKTVIASSKPSASSTITARNAPTETRTVIASSSPAASNRAVSERAIRSRLVAQTQEVNRVKVKGKGKGLSSAKRDAHRYEVVHRQHGHEYQGTPVYRSSGSDAPLASGGRQATSHADTRTNAGNSSLSVSDMYNMLAHSAVLDDNSGVVRQPVRATLPVSPRASSGDASNWSADLSQRRITDATSQFSK
jgi:hypothetical protein